MTTMGDKGKRAAVSAVEASCAGKKGIETRELAMRVAGRIAHSKTQRRRDVYRCRACGLWHLGSPSRRPPNPRKERPLEPETT